MKLHNVKQGTDDWHRLRAAYFTASEAPAMMGASKYMSRDELLAQKATGITPDVSEHQQRIFDQGHAAEEAARPLAEAIIKEELYPVTGTDNDLLASFDGLTLGGDIIFEHKLWNEKLAENVGAGELDPHYYWQLEQQLLVSGAECVLFVVSDGTSNNFEHMTYKPVDGRASELKAGWAQFAADLDDYQVQTIKNTPLAAPVVDLPAINYKLDGLALSSNLELYKTAALQLVEDSKTELQTDQDFADREALNKTFKTAEAKIKLAKEQVLSEIKSVDDFSRELGHIGELIRSARLNGEKQIKARKTQIRSEIIGKAQYDLDEFLKTINNSLEVSVTPERVDFNAAMRGKKTVKSLQEAANDELAKAKINITGQAETIRSNLKTLAELADDKRFLFSDLQFIAHKAPDDFTALVKARLSDHQHSEAEKLKQQEAERQRQIEQAQAEIKTVKQNLDNPVPADTTSCPAGNEEISMIQYALAKQIPSITTIITDYGELVLSNNDAKQVRDLLDKIYRKKLNKPKAA